MKTATPPPPRQTTALQSARERRQRAIAHLESLPLDVRSDEYEAARRQYNAVTVALDDALAAEDATL